MEEILQEALAANSPAYSPKTPDFSKERRETSCWTSWPRLKCLVFVVAIFLLELFAAAFGLELWRIVAPQDVQ